MRIIRKREVAAFIKRFEEFGRHDGCKYYLVIETVAPKGTLTIMKYDLAKCDPTLKGESFTYHRTNESFSDIKEIPIDIDTLKDMIWQNRKAINQALKVTVG